MVTMTHEVHVQAPAEEVFAALTTLDGLQGWYTASAEGDPSQGGELHLHFPGRESFSWRVTEATSPSAVRWECAEGPGSAAGTTVAFALSPMPDGRTAVVLTHDGLDEGHESFASCNTRWGGLLTHLKETVEQKKPVPVFA